MFGLGTQEILIMLIVLTLLFGAKKLPELGRSVGDGLREFKRATHALAEDDNDKS